MAASTIPIQPVPYDFEKYRKEMRSFIGEDAKTQVFWDALDFAIEAHNKQWRRSGDPYIMHPCSVARILADELDIRNAEILAAALLHDTIEDVEEITREVIRQRFGPNVEAIVEGCTKVTNYIGDRQNFKKLVHRKIFSGAAAKLEVMVVKLADRLHNLRTLSSMPTEKQQKIADETLDIYTPLATILGLFNIKRELYNLALTYRFPEQSRHLQSHIDSLSHNTEVLHIIDTVQNALTLEGLEGKVSMRTKGLWGYYDARNRIMIENVESPHEILVLISTRIDCYQALGILNQMYPPIPRSIRDFIANPKPTGYQGLHARTNINGHTYLFRIRTEEMARRAQRGMVHNLGSDNSASNKSFKETKEMLDVLGKDDSVSYRDIIAASGQKEIYTYTPQGERICLPVNSCVLDFAFRVHTNIGQTCIGALIGNQKVGSGHQLRDGQVIKIIRHKEPVQFDPSLRDLCKTPQGQSEISKTFRLRRETISRQIGASLLSQELRRYGVPFEVIEKEGMADILTYFDVKSMDDLFLHLGEGRVRLRELIYEICNGLYVGRPILFQPTGAFNRVELATLDPIIIKSSSCCKPNPLDKGLIGLLSKRGVLLHRKDCTQLQKLHFQREDAVEVRWKLKETNLNKSQRIIVIKTARNQLLTILSKAPEEMKLIDVIRLGKDSGSNADWEVHFQVANLYELKQIERHFARFDLHHEFELDQ